MSDMVTEQLDALAQRAAWYAQDGEDDSIIIPLSRYRLLLDVASAAERRRLTRLEAVRMQSPAGYVAAFAWHNDALLAEDAALERLEAHLASEQERDA